MRNTTVLGLLLVPLYTYVRKVREGVLNTRPITCHSSKKQQDLTALDSVKVSYQPSVRKPPFLPYTRHMNTAHMHTLTM